jgi:protein-tyrosine phosphatase
MPDVLDWRRHDLPSIVECAARHLREGRLVALPTEAGYECFASALHPAAVAQLSEIVGPDEPLAIILGEAPEVFDWLPFFRGAGLRLIRAFWPGPLTLLSDAGSTVGLARQLPEQVLRRLFLKNHLPVRLPDHDWPGPLRRLVTGPLLAASLPGVPRDIGQIERGREQLAVIVDGSSSPFAKPPTLVYVQGKSALIVREGGVPRPDVDDALPCRIVFLCTGNTCRSPLAEGLCKALLSGKLGCAPAALAQQGYCVQSAGMAAGPGNPGTAEAVAVAQAYSADLSGHSSQPLSIELLSRADLVFTMTWSHLGLLRNLRVPVGPVPQLLSLAGLDVDDPIGGSDEIYRTCAAQIWRCLNERLPEILEM